MLGREGDSRPLPGLEKRERGDSADYRSTHRGRTVFPPGCPRSCPQSRSSPFGCLRSGERDDAPPPLRLAAFFDLENVAIGVRDARLAPFDVGRVLTRLEEEGPILVRRAYADWDRWSPYKRGFHEAGFERIDLPGARLSGKNRADIQIVVDALETCHANPNVDAFALVSGDSDFLPLVAKLREHGKRTIGVGLRSSTSALLAAQCDRFVVYDDLPAPGFAPDAPAPPRAPAGRREAFRRVLEAAAHLLSEDKELHSSLVKDTIRRREPRFDEVVHGYASFNQLLEDAQSTGLLRLRRDPRSGTYVIAELVES